MAEFFTIRLSSEGNVPGNTQSQRGKVSKNQVSRDIATTLWDTLK